MQLIVAIFTKLAEIPQALGFGTTIWAIAGLLLLGLTIKFVERADRLLERFQKRWRKLSPGARWVLIAFAVVMFGPGVWHAFPKGPSGIALVLGFLTVFMFGGLNHARRYGLVDTTPAKAWKHHIEVSRAARKHTAALHDSTGKKGGRARKPTVKPDGMEFVVQAEYGMSDVETAEAYNERKMNSALADRFGQDAVQDIHAEPVGDGTVRVNLLSARTKDDFFDTSHPWPGMES